MTSIRNILKKYFGFSDFRKGQGEVIESILEGRDTLVVMPTGGGKSLCYQLPAIVAGGTAIVVSPLIALMKDQVDALSNIDIPATFINSSLPFEEVRSRMQRARAGEFKLVYVAPERLETESFLRFLKEIKVSFFAVDEAHCISEWGHDFRPAYLNINKALEVLGDVSVVALTATATPEVQDDIVRVLNMKNPRRFIRGFDRANLTYNSEESSNKVARIAQIIKSTKKGSTIIYCGTRKKTEEISGSLTSAGYPCTAYHAGLKSEERQKVQEDFISDRTQVIAATNAFGMGIDKPDVRNVIHVDFTSTLEAYYQEAGRAGRDGNPANCYLIFDKSDIGLQKYFIQVNYPTPQDLYDVYSYITSVERKAGKTLFSSVSTIAGKINKAEMLVDSALAVLVKHDLILRDGLINAKVRLSGDRNALSSYHQNAPERRKEALDAILRSLSGEAFHKPVELKFGMLKSKFGVAPELVEEALRSLSYAGLVEYESTRAEGAITMLKDKIPFKELPIDHEEIKTRRDYAYQKLLKVFEYAETHDCKRNFILSYFNESDIKDKCGKCSSCKGKHVNNIVNESDEVTIKKILNGCKALNGRFGKSMLVNYLIGEKDEKLKRLGFTSGGNYGSLKHLDSKRAWAEVSKLIDQGYIIQSKGDYPLVTISSKGLAVISGTSKNEKSSPIETESSGKAKIVKKIIEKPQTDKDLADRLSMLVHSLAEQEKVAPRAIMSEKAIKEIATAMPQTRRDFANIKGVSAYWLEKYSQLFINMVSSYIKSQTKGKKETDSRAHQIQTLFKSGLDIAQVAQRFGSEKGEIAAYIQDYIQSGGELDRKAFVGNDLFKQLSLIISKEPYLNLSKIRAKLSTTTDFAMLRIAVAFVRKELNLGVKD